jgi:hypothetical protein
MKRFIALALSAFALLPACSGSPNVSRAAVPPSATGTLSSYRVPLAHDAKIDAAAAAGAKRPGRDASTIGSLPTIDVTIAIMDAPKFGLGDQVNIAILGVEAVGEDGNAYAVVTYDAPMLVNVLQYQKSALVLGHAQLPNQRYTSLRLAVSSSASSVYNSGVTYPVQYGYFRARSFTAAPSDIALIDFPANVRPDTGAVTILADFNTVESIRIQGQVALVGSRIVSAPYDASSVIAGTVVNNASTPVSSASVSAVDTNGNVAASTLTDANGKYELHALVGGIYQLQIGNDYTTAAGDEIVSSGASSSDDVVGPKTVVPGGFKVTLPPIVD